MVLTRLQLLSIIFLVFLNKYALTFNYYTAGPIVNALKEANHVLKHRYFFPGHNGGYGIGQNMKDLVGKSKFLKYDIPEMDEFDNLFDPAGPIKESQEQVAKVYNSKRCWYLVNGSTVGILASILSCADWFRAKNPGKTPTFLVSRDCHKAVFNALELSNAKAILLPCIRDPEFDVYLGNDVEVLRRIIEEKSNEICGLVITRPSYVGSMIPSESLTSILRLAKSRNIFSLIDEAHGSHLKWTGLGDAMSCGADLCVQSVHKSLSSMTPGALLHLNQDSVFESNSGPSMEQLLSRRLSMLMTSSVNALILASIESSVASMEAAMSRPESEAVKTMKAAYMLKTQIHKQSGSWNLQLLDDSSIVKKHGFALDPMKLTVRYHNCNSQSIDEKICSEDQIYCELNQPKSLTFAIPFSAKQSSLKTLKKALFKQRIKISPTDVVSSNTLQIHDLQEPLETVDYSQIARMSEVSQTLNNDNISALQGQISADNISLYPPGIPLVLRGQVLSHSTINTLLDIQTDIKQSKLELVNNMSGKSVDGAADSSLETIKLLK